jgi:hypothetical protein
MTNLIATYTPGTNRTDGGGLAWGVRFIYTGTSGLLVTQLGARMGTGNSGNAVISLSSGGGSNNGTLNAQATVILSGTVGAFIYGAVTSYALVNGTLYCLGVSITAGQNLADTGAVTMNNASSIAGIFQYTPGNGSGVSSFGSNNMYAGVDMVFGSAAASSKSNFFFAG